MSYLLSTIFSVKDCNDTVLSILAHVPFIISYWNDVNSCLKLPQDLAKRESQLKQTHSMLLSHHDSTMRLEYRHMQNIHQRREDLMKKQHSTERDNQIKYNQHAERELKKKHAMETKQHPKSLRAS